MKFLKWLLIIIVILAALFFTVGKPYLQKQTKKHSPEKVASYAENGFDLKVNYSSPSKKGRVIFGELVPYDVVWRTGANEPTTFTTASNINVMGRELAAGTYSLWTIPNPKKWKVIFNSEVPDWGVTVLSGGAKTTRDPAHDALQIEADSNTLMTPQEQFTIDFVERNTPYLTLSWDKTGISIPISK